MEPLKAIVVRCEWDIKPQRLFTRLIRWMVRDHIFALIEQANGRLILVDLSTFGLSIAPVTLAQGYDLVYNATVEEVIEVDYDPGAFEREHRLGFVSCVSLMKRLFNIHKPWVLTPKGVMKELRRGKK